MGRGEPVLLLLGDHVYISAVTGVKYCYPLTTIILPVVGAGAALACDAQAHRYDIGVPFGYVEAQLALALHGNRREQVIRSLREILQQNDEEMLAFVA